MAERVHCLYRVSTTKQVDHDELNQADIPVQRKACREFAKKMGWVIVGEEQETGVSGYKVSADDRDKLQLIKKQAEQGKFDILLVFMFDRLGRKSDETPFVVEWFVKHGVRVWSVNEGEQRFESHTDRLTNYIRYWQADGESQKTSIRTKTALSQMVLEGRFRGGKTPYGYRLEKSGILNKRKHEVNRLVIDEEEAEIVRMMFDLCVSSGYGKFRLAHFLNDHGIRNRKGETWHDATIGAILHNPLYKGILRSGETYSEPFEELQIIKPELFDMAQSLMTQRTNENKEYRTLPLNTTGQSLLSGNVFCGHCGGRLTLTTNGKVYRQADGTPAKKKRIRYVCYSKTRHRADCDGQTGYTMHILDDMIIKILHQVFDKMKTATSDMIVGNACQKQMALLQGDLKRAKTENTKANTDYESLKAEVLKAVQGKSALPMEVLNEMLEETRQRVLDTSRKVTELTMELEDEHSKMNEMQSEFERIATWSEIFDSSDIATQKMICGYIIKRVSVYRDYQLSVEFNINIEQFLNGIDSVEQTDCFEQAMAQ
ncbi:MAG: recombinase family protein [Clostridiales bacterium]|nr:recombinase family protein [Clostridiales bacterium]